MTTWTDSDETGDIDFSTLLEETNLGTARARAVRALTPAAVTDSLLAQFTERDAERQTAGLTPATPSDEVQTLQSAPDGNTDHNRSQHTSPFSAPERVYSGGVNQRIRKPRPPLPYYLNFPIGKSFQTSREPYYKFPEFMPAEDCREFFTGVFFVEVATRASAEFGAKKKRDVFGLIPRDMHWGAGEWPTIRSLRVRHQTSPSWATCFQDSMNRNPSPPLEILFHGIRSRWQNIPLAMVPHADTTVRRGAIYRRQENGTQPGILAAFMSKRNPGEQANEPMILLWHNNLFQQIVNRATKEAEKIARTDDAFCIPLVNREQGWLDRRYPLAPKPATTPNTSNQPVQVWRLPPSLTHNWQRLFRTLCRAPGEGTPPDTALWTCTHELFPRLHTEEEALNVSRFFRSEASLFLQERQSYAHTDPHDHETPYSLLWTPTCRTWPAREVFFNERTWLEADAQEVLDGVRLVSGVVDVQADTVRAESEGKAEGGVFLGGCGGEAGDLHGL
ncbi:hypothetical protein [Streptomyces sp. NPDC058330]|uniref:hypothetical protein n=1 Tax=Streptomyces sp. NPDC058330 TaxID=3346449 RepID=UPI0036E03CCF